MDPTSFLSAVAATMQAGQSWSQYRDPRLTEAMFNSTFSSACADPAIVAQAYVLRSIVPGPVFDAIAERSRKSWGRYLETLRNPRQYLPAEIDMVTIAVKTCITRELRRVAEINDGHLPDGVLKEWWASYAAAPQPARPIL